MSLLGERDPVTEELKNMDIDNLTPVEALLKLHRIKEMLDS